MPKASGSFFNYWQSAPRWRLLPWLANLGNLAMRPHVEGRKREPITLIKQTKDKEGTWEGGGESLRTRLGCFRKVMTM